jgi:hypothetical protein
MAETYTQVPPDSTGNKIRTRTRIVGANTVHEQAVYQTALPTYYALADAVAFAQNKHLISLLNGAGSGKVLAIKKLFLIDVQVATVTGVAIRSDFKRITAHSGGTAITPVSMDSINPALPAEISARTGATAVTEGALLFPLAYSNDEVGATQAFPSSILLQGLNFIPEGIETQEVRLRPGEGVTLKQITNSTVGSFSYLIVFTVDDEV